METSKHSAASCAKLLFLEVSKQIAMQKYFFCVHYATLNKVTLLPSRAVALVFTKPILLRRFTSA